MSSLEGLERFYAEGGDDPWGFEHRWYEQRKRALTLAALPRPRFARAFEPGCSTGVLSEALAARCDALVVADGVEAPLVRARERLAALPHVRVERRVLPAQWPAGPFDLVVVSELGYFLPESGLADLARRARASLAGDGVLLACHWRHGGGGALTGDEVHAVLREVTGLAVLAEHVEDDFRLEVLVTPPARSVARAEGLLG